MYCLKVSHKVLHLKAKHINLWLEGTRREIQRQLKREGACVCSLLNYRQGKKIQNIASLIIYLWQMSAEVFGETPAQTSREGFNTVAGNAWEIALFHASGAWEIAHSSCAPVSFAL